MPHVAATEDTMAEHTIRHRYTDAVLYTGGGESLREVVEQAVRVGANLVGAKLGGAKLGGAYLVGANLVGAKLGGANLGGANLADAYLADANLVGANLVGANLGGANLGGANLADAYLADANLVGANLVGAYLGGANLGGANLGGANLADAYLVGAYLGGANLVGANLVGANLGGDRKLTGLRPVLQIGPIGSRCAYLVSYITDAGVYVRAGCWFGLLADFGKIVAAQHSNNVHGQEYTAAIAMIEAHARLWTPVAVVAEAA
jgi:hypothetical protein